MQRNAKEKLTYCKFPFPDGLLLSELLTSNGARMSHINAEESPESLTALDSLFSSQSSFDRADTISNISYNLQTKILVVGGLQKWQKILLEVKAYEVDLVVISRDSTLQFYYPFAVEARHGYNRTMISEWHTFCKYRSTKIVTYRMQRSAEQIIGLRATKFGRILLTKGLFAPVDVLRKEPVLVHFLQFSSLSFDIHGFKVFAPIDFLTKKCFEPSTFMIFNDIDGELTLKDCFLTEIMKYLSQRLHFRYSYLMAQQKDWGIQEGNNWTGAIGLVIRGEADMIPFMPIMSPAHDVIAYTKPIAFTTEGMLVSLPRPCRAFMFFRFYQIEVWISLLSSVIVITYALRKMFRFHVGIEKPVSFPSCFWLIFGSLLQQGSTHLPRTSACRIILATWWLLVIVVTTTYSANFVAFLVSNQNKYIVKSLEELANHETVTLAINEESTILDTFKVMLYL
ncbi:hypothetical protein AVEN_67400-1 [Araneus ventricosus]|uniref:Uncharacterized protein n=1 Tax=Araneus ventricosus TaxID=182803 RepID=A0A4Y2J2Q8_ARAVE|nr:hypothetical protein AVEN_67400-1 [Araneus ventricosus]